MTTKLQRQEAQEAAERLREWLPPGSTVYTVLRHTSRSGMLRVIDLYAIQDGEPTWLSGLASRVIGWSRDEKHDGIRVTGCGMDMGFHLVYTLSRYLYPDGFECTGERCPSNDHSNGDREYGPHHHGSGGYAIRQRWM